MASGAVACVESFEHPIGIKLAVFRDGVAYGKRELRALRGSHEVDELSVIIGRLVVLPDYRDHHLGSRVINEAETWINELGYKTILIDSRLEAIGFYEKLGFEHVDDTVIRSGTFDCVRMKKTI